MPYVSHWEPNPVFLNPALAAKTALLRSSRGHLGDKTGQIGCNYFLSDRLLGNEIDGALDYAADTIPEGTPSPAVTKPATASQRANSSPIG